MADEEITSTNDTDDGRLSVGDLVRMFEASEEATQTARLEAERDRDYVDNKQWTAEEQAKLKSRKQPIVTDNRIKPKIDFITGWEIEQRIAPRAMPRTPMHEQDADGATQALRAVTQEQDYSRKRSDAWRNMVVEGAGGIRVYAEPSRSKTGYGAGQMKIKIDHVSWDRMFWDPHSGRHDFDDAGYKGIVIWMDFDDAIAKYPGKEAREALDTTLATASQSDTYDDKPHYQSWADKKRKRVRICQIWIKRAEDWHFAEFTKGGILKAGPSPYLTDTGESDCELFFASAFINRENERFGYVREMISMQDEINKRRSKAMHDINSKRILFRKGVVADVEKTRSEISRPDGAIEVETMGEPLDNVFRYAADTEQAQGNLQMMQDAKNSIDLKGPNATMLGDKAQGSASASGKAIIASQQGGKISMGTSRDNLRNLDLRVFRAVWNRVRQFWTAEKWVAVTDDERNLKWVALNVGPQGPQLMQMLRETQPDQAAKLVGAVRNVAELDCDIIIDEAPDTLTPQIEYFQQLVELKKVDVGNEIPFRAILEAAPFTKDRAKLLSQMDEKAQQPPPPPPEIMKAQIDGEVKQMQAQQDAQLAQQRLAIESELEREKVRADIDLEWQKAAAQIEIMRQKAAAEIQIKQSTASRTEAASTA